MDSSYGTYKNIFAFVITSYSIHYTKLYDSYTYEKRNELLKKVRAIMIAQFEPDYNKKD